MNREETLAAVTARLDDPAVDEEQKTEFRALLEELQEAEERERKTNDSALATATLRWLCHHGNSDQRLVAARTLLVSRGLDLSNV